MATLVAFLADIIGNYSLLMVNFVNFLNRRFSGLEHRKIMKLVLSKS